MILNLGNMLHHLHNYYKLGILLVFLEDNHLIQRNHFLYFHNYLNHLHNIRFLDIYMDFPKYIHLMKDITLLFQHRIHKHILFPYKDMCFLQDIVLFYLDMNRLHILLLDLCILLEVCIHHKNELVFHLHK